MNISQDYGEKYLLWPFMVQKLLMTIIKIQKELLKIS